MAVKQEPQNGKGSINKLNRLNAGLGIGFVGVDSYMRMQEGESAPVHANSNLWWPMGASVTQVDSSAPTVPSVVSWTR